MFYHVQNNWPQKPYQKLRLQFLNNNKNKLMKHQLKTLLLEEHFKSKLICIINIRKVNNLGQGFSKAQLHLTSFSVSFALSTVFREYTHSDSLNPMPCFSQEPCIRLSLPISKKRFLCKSNIYLK